MISNFSSIFAESEHKHPIQDHSLPFADYIHRCSQLLEEHRDSVLATPSLKKGQNESCIIPIQSIAPARIIEANCPYELTPTNPIPSTNGKRFKYGVLLIHGLLDSPFTLRDIGTHLQNKGMLCRSILLPGHGTKPNDLLTVSFYDWIKAMHYGIESLRQEVDHLYIVGYSTGAALAVHQALQDKNIAGLILLAPAIRIKSPVDILINWHGLIKLISKANPWVTRADEVDYAKYHSIPLNAVSQVSLLTDVLESLNQDIKLNCPLFMAVSREDETISSQSAIEFFYNTTNPVNRLYLYSSYERRYPDHRIILRNAHYPDLRINHFSHVSIPFKKDNPHYGQEGDYLFASHSHEKNIMYGAYNPLENEVFGLLNKLGLVKHKRRELTYNPDFDEMAKQITNFIIT